MSYNTLIIDSMNMAYRAFFKLPAMSNTSGDATSSIYGFIRIMNSVYQKFQPDNAILVWDSKDNKRKAICKDYKAKRKREVNDDLINFIKQIVTLRESLQKIGIPTFYKVGLESDDLIAVAISKYPKDYRHLIYTSDNDLYQLLDDNVDIYNGADVLTKAWFISRHKYHPRLFSIYKAMTGCGSDNVEGIPNIGEKKATKILEECDYDVDRIYARIEELGYSKYFDKALRLVTLPLDLDYLIEELNTGLTLKLNKPKLAEFLCNFSINSISVNEFLVRIPK